MKNIIAHLETKPETQQIKRLKDFLKKQLFVKEHFQKGGTVTELELTGFKFGTVDLSNLEKRRPEAI